MSKAFTKDTDSDDEEELEAAETLPAELKNYMTPQGFATLQKELQLLQRGERPKVVEIVAWAAGNGDRSENGDYIYGKKRLREIDRRVRFLTKRIASAEVVDPARQQGLERVFFGATVTYAAHDGSEHTVTLVGIDEADMEQGKISWISPMAKALMKACVADEIELHAPGKIEKFTVKAISYGTGNNGKLI